MTVAPTITLQPRIPATGTRVILGLGDGFAIPTLDGGWQALTRLRRTSSTDYAGGAPISMAIPFVLDGSLKNTSVEPTMTTLYNMMLVPVGSLAQPTVFTIQGVPIPFYSQLWVLTDISITTEIRRSSDGQRTQVVGSITIMQYIGTTIILSAAKKAKAKAKKSKKSSGTKTYVVKKGDDLEKIAAHFYHKSSKWHLIATANHLRGPKSVHAGQRIKIPKG